MTAAKIDRETQVTTRKIHIHSLKFQLKATRKRQQQETCSLVQAGSQSLAWPSSQTPCQALQLLQLQRRQNPTISKLQINLAKRAKCRKTTTVLKHWWRKIQLLMRRWRSRRFTLHDILQSVFLVPTGTTANGSWTNLGTRILSDLFSTAD